MSSRVGNPKSSLPHRSSDDQRSSNHSNNKKENIFTKRTRDTSTKDIIQNNREEDEDSEGSEDITSSGDELNKEVEEDDIDDDMDGFVVYGSGDEEDGDQEGDTDNDNDNNNNDDNDDDDDDEVNDVDGEDYDDQEEDEREREIVQKRIRKTNVSRKDNHVSSKKTKNNAVLDKQTTSKSSSESKRKHLPAKKSQDKHPVLKKKNNVPSVNGNGNSNNKQKRDPRPSKKRIADNTEKKRARRLDVIEEDDMEDGDDNLSADVNQIESPHIKSSTTEHKKKTRKVTVPDDETIATDHRAPVQKKRKTTEHMEEGTSTSENVAKKNTSGPRRRKPLSNYVSYNHILPYLHRHIQPGTKLQTPMYEVAELLAKSAEDWVICLLNSLLRGKCQSFETIEAVTETDVWNLLGRNTFDLSPAVGELAKKSETLTSNVEK